MNPVTHFLISTSLANSFNLTKKNRAIVTVSGIVPDIDGLGIIFDFLASHKEQELVWWSKYHHTLGHNIGFGLFLALIVFALSTRRWLVSFLVFACFHLHLTCDLIGSRGPDGYQWPIPYLLPFSNAWQWIWAGQWHFNSWPNFLITFVVTFHMLYMAWKKGVSPLEIISSNANASFVSTLRQRFGTPIKKF